MDGQIELTQRQRTRLHAHAVCFFQDDEYPAERIAEYVKDGLAAGAAVVFATPCNLARIEAALSAIGTNVAACIAGGRLLFGDAEVAARSIAAEGSPRRIEFDQRVASCVDQLVAEHGQVRAYGEIVDVLTCAGDPHSAAALERWWEELLARRPLELLCGYRLSSFASAEQLSAFRHVCDAHLAVELTGNARSSDARLAAELHQAVAALQTEVTRRQHVQSQQEALREDVRLARDQALTATEHLARLQHFTSALSEAASVEEIARAVLAELESTFHADVGALALAVEDGERLRLITRSCVGREKPESVVLSSSDLQLPIAAAYRGGEPIWLTARADIARDYPRALAEMPLASSICAVPLVVRGRRLGAISVLYQSGGPACGAMRALIDDYARQVALAVDRALAHDAAQVVRVRLQLLADATARIAEAKLDLRAVVDALVREVTRAVFAQRCTVDLHAPDGKALLADDSVPRAEPGVSSVVVPLVTASELIGSLTAVRDAGQATFSGEDKQLLRDLADRAALCIENALLYERARAERERTERERTRAEGANRAKDEFLAMLGHELRNPLSPIRTAVHLMRLRQPGLQVRERTIIERQVNHMVRLVDDLLDVSRIARGKVELKRAPVDLRQVVADAVEIASPLLEARSHALRTELPAEALIVHGDANRLAQVVANLLTNAAKYTPVRGRIEIEASVSDTAPALRGGAAGSDTAPALRGGAAGDRGRVALVVRDNGNGIESGLMPRLFDLFMQGKQASDRAEGGLGLGLAIARNLVELHGGTLRAASAGAGYGSAFTLELPLIEPCAAPNHTSTEGSSTTARAVCRRVLVVDDNTDAADLIGDALRAAGHRVRVAYDGPSALQLARDFQPDLALLDIGLPVMDGYELGRRLATLAGCEQIRLIALTGYGQTTDLQRSLAAGFDEHLVKPIDLERVLAVIERV